MLFMPCYFNGLAASKLYRKMIGLIYQFQDVIKPHLHKALSGRIEVIMNSEYRLAIFKGFVTFVFVGIIGFAIENGYSSSQAERDRERVLLEANYSDLSRFGASLSYLRAVVSRLPSGQEAAADNLKDYRAAFRQFSEAKVPFIVGIERLGIKDELLISSFGKLNEIAIKLDGCVLGTRGEDCDLEKDFLLFVKLSTAFEGAMIQAMAAVK
ncbi:hypothetical protein [Hoeflea sp.]|uniref:hypothetical protein n=1 Tax=Hoeflea sp. TaxID=1940281 RepID=UPI003A91753F